MALIFHYVVQSQEFTVEEIQHNFLVSGHSFSTDFGVMKKKTLFPNIYVPNDWVNVITSAKNQNHFKVVLMEKENFYSAVCLEKLITNRKASRFYKS